MTDPIAGTLPDSVAGAADDVHASSPTSAPAPPAGRRNQALELFWRNKAAVFGLVLFLAILFMTLFANVLYPKDPGDIVAPPFQPPSLGSETPLGTDYLGRDVLAGIVHGGAPSLIVSVLAVVLILLIGVTIGSLAGFYGGWVDSALMRFTELFQVLPALLLAMTLVTLFGPSTRTISIAIGVVAWPSIARVTRAEFLRLRGVEFVKAARAIGSTDRRIIWQVIFPNALPPIIVSTTLIMGAAILFESGLSFLGLGDPNNISWGLMIGLNRSNILNAWWTVTFPGLAIFLTVLSFSLIGDGLQDAFNPKLRSR